MGILNLETEKAPAGMRRRRFLAFLIDAAAVLLLAFLVYRLTGEPDFFYVKETMDTAQAAGGQDAELTAAVFDSFNHAYGILLLLWFAYEAVTQTALRGSTLGKLLMGLRLSSQKPGRSALMQAVLMAVRSALKMLSLYFFQGFPFLICCLTIFTNKECRSGFDMAVKTRVDDRSGKQKGERP